MPLATVRVRLNRTTDDADPVYWSWAVDGAAYDETSGLALINSTLEGIEAAVGVGGSGLLTDMDADLIEAFPGAGGPAYYVQGLAPGIPVGTNVLSDQIKQCAVNELVSSPRGTAVAGRLFIGPMGASNGPILPTDQVALAVLIMQSVAESHIDAGFTPVVISRIQAGEERPTPVGLEIVGFRTDRRIDILKSRRIDEVPAPVDYPLTPA